MIKINRVIRKSFGLKSIIEIEKVQQNGIIHAYYWLGEKHWITLILEKETNRAFTMCNYDLAGTKTVFVFPKSIWMEEEVKKGGKK